MDVKEMKNKSAYHWITIMVCCALAASSIGICTNSLGVFFVPVSTDIGVSRGIYAIHATIANIMNGLFCLVSIRLIRKCNFRTVVSIGILLTGVATMLMSVGNSVWFYYILAVVRGIGCSFFSSPAITYIINNWFEEKHGFAVGLTLCFSGLSGAVFSPMFSSLIALMGWRFTYVVMGIFVIALALPGTLFLLYLYPEKKDLLPYGGMTSKISETPQKNTVKDKVSYFSIPVIIMVIFTFLLTSISGIAQHFPGYAESMGCAMTVGATMVSAAMIGNIVFKLLIGAMSDKIGSFNACKIMVSINIVSLILLNIINPSQNYAVTLAIAFIYGTVYAVGGVGISLLTRDIFGAKKYASVFPYIYSFSCIGAASSLTIIGFLFDYFKTYNISIIGGIVFACIDLALIFVLQQIKISQDKKNNTPSAII